MRHINADNILETIRMIEEENLDIRTITMGISLLDCADSDIDRSCEKIKAKITSKAKDLVKTAKEIQKEYGIPIINQRITVTPISLLLSASGGDPVKYAKALDEAAKAVGASYIGGYSALVQKGMTEAEKALILSIPRALSETDIVCASVNVGSSKAGINMDAVRLMGQVVRQCAELTKDRNCIACSKLVVFCNAVEDNPFMAGGFHGISEPDCVINTGVSGPGVVRNAIFKAGKNASMNEIAEIIKKTAFKVTRMGQLVGHQASERLNVPFGIVDLSLAPTPAVGDSVAHILEEIGLETCGGPGTTAALAMLNDAVKKGGVMASSSVGGLSGAFIPVSEDAGMIAAAEKGVLSIEKLEAMTCVCSVGLDMVIIPGDTTAETISAIIADEAAIGMVNTKTTACRLIPAIGKKPGDHLVFGGLMGEGPVMNVRQTDASVMVNRGGRIPAPLHSLKN
ncbi:MAG: PFL family protein [Sphaerochaetaceae bacterium]|nr:PFL family protein [Sphaerochaetaceae bacterium]